MLEGELEYEVDSILDHQIDKDKGETHFKYLVHWRGSGSDHNSWEPDVNLKNAPQIVQSYWNGLKAKGLEVPWDKPTFTSTVKVAQRRGRVVEASTSQAMATSPISMSCKRRIRRNKGKRAPSPTGPVTELECNIV